MPYNKLEIDVALLGKVGETDSSVDCRSIWFLKGKLKLMLF